MWYSFTAQPKAPAPSAGAINEDCENRLYDGRPRPSSFRDGRRRPSYKTLRHHCWSFTVIPRAEILSTKCDAAARVTSLFADSLVVVPS